MNDGEDGKRDGMDRAERAANPIWKLAASLAVTKAARELRYLTSDDVVARIPDHVTTHELRAMGPVMREAAKDGLIEQANVSGVKSTRPTLHRSPRTVWRSLLFREAKR